MSPAISALLVYPSTMEAHFGIPGALDGVLINKVTPNSTATMNLERDENTVPHTMIFGDRELKLDFDCTKASRTADLSQAYPGLQIDNSVMTAYADAGVLQGFPATQSGRIWILTDPKVKLERAKVDTYSFSAIAFGYTMDRFAA